VEEAEASSEDAISACNDQTESNRKIDKLAELFHETMAQK